MPTKAEAKMNPAYRDWPRTKRMKSAAEKVVRDNWQVAAAAREFGISRQNLHVHVKKLREEVDGQRLRAEAELASKAGLDPLGFDERLRVPPTFAEFDELYWGSMVCPTCGVHHPTPAFHTEIMDALEEQNTRLLINVPPYHSKSTIVTVKHTVYRLVKNPNHRRLIVTKAVPFGRTFLRAISEMLTNEELYASSARNLIQDWGPFRPEGSGSIWNSEQIYVSGRVTAEKDPSVQIIGLGSQIYGRRADDIVFDDVATLDNSRNPDQVMKDLEWIDKEALSRIGLKDPATWVGTRVNAGDIYSVLGQRPGYKVIRYSAILDEATEQVLWPDHFPFEGALIRRGEMAAADWQLVYQNVDIPGLGASFTDDMVETAKDQLRVVGQFDDNWRMVGGLDPAGASKDAGFTAMVIMGIDQYTGKRFLVDALNVRSMRAPDIKDQMIEWAHTYNLAEWRVEVNGLQSQIFQYDRDLVHELALRGTKVVPHTTTGKNKWDPQFGVETLAPLFHAGLVSVPWGSQSSAQKFQPLLEQLMQFPMSSVSDLVMALWFADLGCRDFLRRATLPMFNERMRVPNRIKKNRRVVDFGGREVRRVPLADQRNGYLTHSQTSYRRSMVGRPTQHWEQPDESDPEGPSFTNL